MAKLFAPKLTEPQKEWHKQTVAVLERARITFYEFGCIFAIHDKGKRGQEADLLTAIDDLKSKHKGAVKKAHESLEARLEKISELMPLDGQYGFTPGGMFGMEGCLQDWRAPG